MFLDFILQAAYHPDTNMTLARAHQEMVNLSADPHIAPFTNNLVVIQRTDRCEITSGLLIAPDVVLTCAHFLVGRTTQKPKIYVNKIELVFPIKRKNEENTPNFEELSERKWSEAHRSNPGKIKKVLYIATNAEFIEQPNPYTANLDTNGRLNLAPFLVNSNYIESKQRCMNREDASYLCRGQDLALLRLDSPFEGVEPVPIMSPPQGQTFECLILGALSSASISPNTTSQGEAFLNGVIRQNISFSPEWGGILKAVFMAIGGRKESFLRHSNCVSDLEGLGAGGLGGGPVITRNPEGGFSLIGCVSQEVVPDFTFIAQQILGLTTTEEDQKIFYREQTNHILRLSKLPTFIYNVHTATPPELIASLRSQLDALSPAAAGAEAQ